MSKFGRVRQASKNADLLGMWHVDFDGHSYNIEFRGAYRSHGYQTDFQHIPTYWFLTSKDGTGYNGWSVRGKAVAREVKRMLAELAALPGKGATVRTVKELHLLT